MKIRQDNIKQMGLKLNKKLRDKEQKKNEQNIKNKLKSYQKNSENINDSETEN